MEIESIDNDELRLTISNGSLSSSDNNILDSTIDDTTESIANSIAASTVKIRKCVTPNDWTRSVYNKLFVITDQASIAAEFYDRESIKCLILHYILSIINSIFGAILVVCTITSLVKIDDEQVCFIFIILSISSSAVSFILSRVIDLLKLSDKANTHSNVSAMYTMLNHEIMLTLSLPKFKRGDAHAFMVRVIFTLNIIDRVKKSVIWNKLDNSEKLLNHNMVRIARKKLKKKETDNSK
jgi:hypothetical protein